jgi:hypothetical protein
MAEIAWPPTYAGYQKKRFAIREEFQDLAEIDLEGAGNLVSRIIPHLG